jgi:hypothetical protein
MFKFLLLLSCLFSLKSNAQQIEQIYINPYTDSLKKGTHNYINVDGKFNNNKYKPLTAKDIEFTTSYGTFEGSDLVIPWDYKKDSCIITATLKSNKTITKTIVMYIKKLEDPELPTAVDTTKQTNTTSTTKKKKKKKS